jgi:ubiquinone biosynthesis accessory factor UbiJ
MSWRDTSLASVNAVLGTLLARDPELAHALAPLQGRRIALDVRATPVRLVLEGRDGCVMVTDSAPTAATPVDARIEGSAMELLALLREPHGSGSVAFHGDLSVLSELRERLVALQPGWSRVVASLLGEQPSAALLAQSRLQQQRFERLATTVSGSVGEYLVDESGLVIGQPELQDFCSDVDHLRADADRLAARLLLLERRRS